MSIKHATLSQSALDLAGRTVHIPSLALKESLIKRSRLRGDFILKLSLWEVKSWFFHEMTGNLLFTKLGQEFLDFSQIIADCLDVIFSLYSL
jgi:hypothetical protein